MTTFYRSDPHQEAIRLDSVEDQEAYQSIGLGIDAAMRRLPAEFILRKVLPKAISAGVVNDGIHESQIEFNGICSATLRTAPQFDWLEDGTRSYRVHKRTSGHLFEGLVYHEYPEGVDVRSKELGE